MKGETQPGVVCLLEREPSERERYSHAATLLALLNQQAAAAAGHGGAHVARPERRGESRPLQQPV